MRASIRGVFFRLCPKCAMLIHPVMIKFETNCVGFQSVEIEGMCGHGHQFEFYMSSEYTIELETTKIDWEEKK